MLPVNEASGAWPVISKVRAGRLGWCLPTFIRNSTFFYAELFAYEDGVVDCWEGLDLRLFRQKLRSSWVQTSAHLEPR